MYSKLNYSYLTLIFAGLAIGIFIVKYLYGSLVKKDTISIIESDLEIILKRSRAFTIINFIMGILMTLGVLFLFLVPLLLKWPNPLELEYVPLVIIVPTIFVFFVFTTTKGMTMDRGILLRKEGEDILVDNRFFGKLADVRAEIVKHVPISLGWSPSYSIRLNKRGRTGFRYFCGLGLTYGLGLDEAEACRDRVNTFFDLNRVPKMT